ncbi:MAG: nucleotidyltransferase domain-containing protein [Anaerolineae bacterium]|nr:nucleotidyltransferase domain-containing protein [Anaerolineae bacterium]
MTAAEHAPLDPAALARRFDAPGVKAIVLMGSYARGDSGPYSDFDLTRVTEGDATHPPESHLIGGHLVVVSDAGPAQVEAWFTRPEVAANIMVGLRQARALVDRSGTFAAIQARARAFVWDATMQERANAWASEQMVGWIEEAHKGLEGLLRGDIGRLLNARFGLSWGLSRVVQVQRGVLVSSENDSYDGVAEAIGRDSRWTRLRRTAFGVEDDEGQAPTLREQVIAGLRLYVETAVLLEGALLPREAELVAETVARIRAALSALPSAPPGAQP